MQTYLELGNGTVIIYCNFVLYNKKREDISEDKTCLLFVYVNLACRHHWIINQLIDKEFN